MCGGSVVSDLILPGRVVVRPPTTPRIEMGEPETAAVLVVPVAGPRGQQGVPGQPGDAAGQIRLVGLAATALSGHRLVTPLSDDTIGYASNDDPDLVHHPLWLTIGAVSEGAEVAVLLLGALSEPSWAWAPGPLFLGQNGQLTQTPPSASSGAAFLAEVGCATSPTSVFFDRQPSIVLT